MRRIGLHIRLQHSILDSVDKALRLQLPFFQCFFVLQETGRLIKVRKGEIDSFLAKRDHFDKLFLHGSYWINLASLGYNGYRELERELALAKQLQFTHLVLHPGAAKGAEKKEQGIDALARALNTLLKTETEIKVLLENTTHGNVTVGSDILDFRALLEKLDKPECIGFCIDTSHAHSFGYTIIDDHDQDMFIEFLDNTLGLDRITLIHLNDTKEKCGVRIDRHATLGEGVIGKKALKRFVMHSQLSHIPILMELPVLSEAKEEMILQEICSWVED